MLTSLHIKNLALMEDASVELEKPSIALIGETGAGKSLIVESLSLLFGARADYSFVRDREKKASVSALFVLEEEFLSRFPHLQEVIEEDHTLLLERVLCPDKSSLKIRMNLSGCLWCFCSVFNGPCSCFVLA